METSERLALTVWSGLTYSAEGIPASHSRKPESAPAKTTRGIFGPSSRVSFAHFDHDTSYWKTSQATFLLDLEQYSETWPDAGTMRSGSVYERPTSARPICVSASSSWPTPDRSITNGIRQEDGKRNTGLNTHAHNWPTARREDGESCGNHPGANDSLTGATRNWPTPRTLTGGGESAERKKELGRTDAGGGHLQAATELWQTPATDSFRSRGGDRKDEMGLDQQARSHQDQATPTGPQSSETSPTLPRRLNPRFVEWLMGFPIGWTEL